MPAPTQSSSSLAITTPLGPDALILERLSGREAIGDLFAFSLTATATSATLDLGQLVGAGVGVALTGEDTTPRHIHGVCVRAVAEGSTYRLELRPWLWRLSLMFGSRIWQNKSALEIVKAVFSAAGETDVEDRTTATYDPLEYCVQYQETALDFVRRLLEEAGIVWYFKHEQSRHVLVLADDSSGFGQVPGDGAIPLLLTPDSQSWIAERRIEAFTAAAQLVSGKATASDFNYLTPATDLTSEATGGTPAWAKASFEVYEHPAGHTAKAAGAAIATRRLAGLQGAAVTGEGRSPFRGLAPGLVFTLSGHPRDDANAAWRLHAVTHSVGLGEYQNSFEARPSATTCRPERVTPRPRIFGSQTAIVVGESGEEITTDQHARVKVQFHWDREGQNDQTSSCWIRVAQSVAGQAWGGLVLPRIGQEVVVSFLDGDPDRPLVTGAVYNATHAPPISLPADKTQSTFKTSSSKGGDGFNELRFEDLAGSEEVFLQAQKDMTVNILNNLTSTVKNARSTTIQEADDTLTISKGNRTTTISKGNETHDVKGTRTLTVEGDETHTNKAALSYDVTGNYTLKVQGNVSIEAGGTLTLKATGGVTIQGATVDVKADSALSLQGATAELKGSATGTVDGGGMLTVKGGLVKIN